MEDTGLVISGAVRRADGSPLVGIPVTLIASGGRQVAVVRTGPEGSYRLPAPIGGSYLLVASAVGHHPAAFLITVAERPVRQEIVLPDLDSAGSRLPRAGPALRSTGPVGVGTGQRSASKPWVALMATVALTLAATFVFWPTSTNRSPLSAAQPTAAPSTQDVATPKARLCSKARLCLGRTTPWPPRTPTSTSHRHRSSNPPR